MIRRLLVPFYLLSLLLSACTASPSPVPAPATAALSANPPTIPPAATSTFTRVPSTPTPTISPAPSPTPSPWACSPLAGVSLANLPNTITNPYAPPALGSDDPHQAVDFSDLSGPNQAAIGGREVHIVLAGEVDAVISDRFPYGNAVLIETHLEDLPSAVLKQLILPTPAPTLPPHPVLTCPTPSAPFVPDNQQRSLYLLYAHLQDTPSLQPGQTVSCGQAFGVIGSSGNALNPHLHLEARVGPAGFRIASMAHYDNQASADEMSSYCTWRVSNLFQRLDPMILFAAAQ